MIHPARKIPYDELYLRLQQAVAEGLIYEHVGSGDNASLRLYCYTEETVYTRQWNEITLMARGLIIDVDQKEVVATPFPKFFNHGEYLSGIPDLPFETFEKMDGSLIIIFSHNGKWKCATKGSLSSDQAKWAQGWLETNINMAGMARHLTLLAEAIYPSNKIVVDYKSREELVLLGGYDGQGQELEHYDLQNLAYILQWAIVRRHQYNSLSELLAKAPTLSCNEEGWVIRFSDGTRIKIKGDEYCRVHRLVSNLTPLAIWEYMKDGDERVEDVRRTIPEEFWEDFDIILSILTKKLNMIMTEVDIAHSQTTDWTDKEVGLRLKDFSPIVRPLIFQARKDKLLEGRARHIMFEMIRPTANRLEGYRSSSAIRRVTENE